MYIGINMAGCRGRSHRAWWGEGRSVGKGYLSRWNGIFLCIASGILVLEILKHDKVWGTICISVPDSKLYEDSSPSPPWFPHKQRSREHAAEFWWHFTPSVVQLITRKNRSPTTLNGDPSAVTTVTANHLLLIVQLLGNLWQQQQQQQQQPFYGRFSGTTRVNRCQKRTSGLYGARED